jgi:hypothetical protein
MSNEKLCGTYIDERGYFHSWISRRLEEAKVLAKYVETGLRYALGVEIVEVDNTMKAVSWGITGAESWCREIDVDEAIKMIRKEASKCTGWKMLSEKPLKCWWELKGSSAELYISEQMYSIVEDIMK